MATVSEFLSVARSQIGKTESPPNSNIVIYNDWYWGKDKYGDWAAWCLVFVLWCLEQVGVKYPLRTASCGEFMRAAQKQDMWVTRNFKPGDVVIYDFSGKQKTTEHCGIVEMEIPDYGVQAIEGNTSVSGSQSNGGMVCRKNRARKYIIGAVRPKFDKEAKEDDMDIEKLLSTITDEQAYALLTKAQKHAATIAEPAWSVTEGQWSKAKEKGVINGGSPEGLIKRDEVVAIMGRIGLLD